MVMQGRALAALLIGCSIASGAVAGVSASVDRARVDANESFNLIIESDNVQSPDPDVSVLAADFDVLGRDTKARTTIINGTIEQTRTWVYALMPTREGLVEIPPIAVGSESTEALTITVDAVDDSVDAGRDVIVTAELDRERTWVQAQVVYTIRILTAVPPRQPRLEEPELTGVDVLFEQLGDDTRYESVIDGRNYSVVERRYALFPQASGTVEIGEVRYSARIWEQSRLSPRRLFRSEPLTLTVEPIPAPPADFPGAAWLPAENVTLSERWNPDDRSVSAGEPLTRSIRVSAAGLLANQLPALQRPESDGLRIYPDQPELETGGSGAGVVGHRTERFAIIAAEAGSYVVPAFELPWWNVNSATWEVARLPAATLVVRAAGEPAGEPATVATATSGGVRRTDERLLPWREISLGLAAGWLLTVLVWWLKSRPRKSRSAPTVPTIPVYRRERRLLREAASAARRGEPREVANKLLAWSALVWPDDPPTGLGAIAVRLGDETGAAIENLDASLYGAATFDGVALAEALTKVGRVGADHRRVNSDPLAPLTPT